MLSQEMPILRIVPADNLVLHEDADPKRVERLTVRLREDGLIKNPPIVAPMDENRYVVLDGANRVSGFWALGVPHALVQVVDYQHVELDTWYHLVTGLDQATLFKAIRGVPGIEVTCTSLEAAREALTNRRSLAYLVCPEGDVYSIDGGGSLQEGARILVDISNVYRGAANIHRVRIDTMPGLTRMYDNVAALIVYPPFTQADILALARDYAKVPTGITRHIIPGRVLRVNMPLSILTEDKSLEAKNEWLKAWEKEKLASKSVRFYAESTYLFDE